MCGMEHDRDIDILDIKAEENTEDLGFLAETSVLERLSEGEAPEETPDLSETQVFENLTSDKREKQPGETAALKKIKDAGNSEDEEGKTSFRSSALKEVLLFFRDLGVCLAVVLVVVNFILRPIQVKGSSMYPTLTNGALGVSNLLGYRMDGIERFDIVIIYVEDKNEYLVKRCVGLPGETVAYRDQTLYINNEPVEEPFFDESYTSTYDVFMEDLDEITLGEDEYFCLGDNRPRSTDSRVYGPFHKDEIVSKGVFIFFPFSGFGVQTW